MGLEENVRLGDRRAMGDERKRARLLREVLAAIVAVVDWLECI
jgi:hypothetical protein